ncbi:uncharacterized protein LOC114529115 isoform X2 [Dendronephthya gigantea]|uniref:uncharacterized protein LOC114529115 isoform X2 n=1 Tax=Dendronephthya gigantea TaxID=151771 RepID=UPI00106CECA6|nr:uncharacterized protein LOC114529115 isoform X2 [Dendronephthya gigantea]
MAEAFSAAGEALRATASVTGGKFVITIGTDSVEVAKEVTKEVCGTITKLGLGLGALYAGYSLLKPLVDTAVKKALGGDRDDQDARDIRPGCLHVDLHCLTDKRFLEVLEDYESGKMKERLQEELSLVGIKVEGMKVKIENMEEVNERKEDIRKREMARRSSFGGYDEERFVNKVDAKLLCSICFKVVKDPVQCPNEHDFCRSCIQKWLQESSETCPTCQHHLTEENLAKPRFLTETLDSLKIRCDYASRGCREVVELEFLDRHVERCGYSPTRCTNTGCSEIINRNEQERHENELCRFRIIVCDECKQQVTPESSRSHPCFMRKEIDELTKKLEKERMKKEQSEEFIRKLMADVARQNVVIDDHQRKMNSMTSEVKYPSNETRENGTGRRKIFVCGGRNDKHLLNTVESFSWPINIWAPEQEMGISRVCSSSFLYEGQIYVSGGWTGHEMTDTIKMRRMDQEWIEAPVKMPIKCRGHGMVCNEDKAILTGGRINEDDISDGIYEIKLTPPYTTTLLTQLPERKYYHGCEIIDNEVVVVGGRTSDLNEDTKNTVYAYDVNNNECKTLPPLPFPVAEMASVSYKSNIILIGGHNEKGRTLNTVFMYEVKTGKIKMLPCLNHKRAACTAVITGNLTVVMGGFDYETETCLSSVECLDLSTNEWRELSPMTEKRGFATAVLLS